MNFKFPNLPKLSLWDIACGHTGQNAQDPAPSNETRYKLAELVHAVRDTKLWIEFVQPGNDHGFVTALAGDGNRAAADADWRKLNQVTVRREDWERYMETVEKERAHLMELMREQSALWARRQPAPLCGEGYSEEMRKETTLTKYLVFDTWTPAAAAMLVCGLQAPIVDGLLGTEIPAGRIKGLDDDWKSEQNCTAIADAKRVLGIWLTRENPPAKVRPLDFIAWCKTKNIDTAWLSSIEEQAATADLPCTRDRASATALEATLPPPDHLLTLDGLANAICPGEGREFDRHHWKQAMRQACGGDNPTLIARYADGREVEPGTAGAQHGSGTHILSRDAAKWLESKGWTVKHELQLPLQASEQTPAPAAGVEQKIENGAQRNSSHGKLTREQRENVVTELRKPQSERRTHQAIADDYSVSRQAISKIANGLKSKNNSGSPWPGQNRRG